MKKIYTGILPGMALLVLLSGCINLMADRAARYRDMAVEQQFDNYTRLAIVENGPCVIDVENSLSSNEWLRITIKDQPKLWKLYEIPAKSSTTIELGSMVYILQLIDPETGQPTSSATSVSHSGASIVITTGTGFPFNIHIPE